MSATAIAAPVATAAATAAATATATALDFDELARTHRSALYKYAYRLAGNRDTAEDLVQDSLLRAWRSFDRLENPAAVLGWLKTIVRRENARRFERIQPRESELPVEDICAARKTYDTSAEAFVLRRAIRALPAEYREPLILQVLHGFSQQEIAERLGLTSAGVGTRLFRARQKLRAALGERA
jgi:RNA polymerase sigma-70 factor, ECF subfamily